MNVCQCGKPADAGVNCWKCYQAKKDELSDADMIRRSSENEEDFQRRFSFFQQKKREVEHMESGRDVDKLGRTRKPRKGA